MRTAVDIVHKIRAVIPQFDREMVVRKAAARRKKAQPSSKDVQLLLEGIPGDILEAVARELKL